MHETHADGVTLGRYSASSHTPTSFIRMLGLYKMNKLNIYVIHHVRFKYALTAVRWLPQHVENASKLFYH